MQRRSTVQKQIIFHTIDLLGHTTTDELIGYIRNHHQQVSLATIYRNLSILQEDGQIRKIHLESGDVFETVKPDHFHFVCNKCGKVSDISKKEYQTFLDEIHRKSHEEIEMISVSLYGICHSCKQKEEKKNEKVCL